MSQEGIYVINSCDDYDAPHTVTMQFSPRGFGSSYDGFSALTRVVARLEKYGNITPNEATNTLVLVMKVSDKQYHALMIEELRQMCSQLFNQSSFIALV